MTSRESYLSRILEAAPGLQVRSVEFNERGQNSDVVVINGELVFRFPKYTQVLERLKVETAILTAIHGRVPLPVPVPIFVSLEGWQVGAALIGYRLIPGQPLWRDLFHRIADGQTAGALASQLGSFLKALHGVPSSEAVGCALPLMDTYDQCLDIYTRMQANLFGYMRPDARRWATGHFEGFLGEPGNFAYEPVLKHGDFGPSNILFSEETQRICGVIDFGSSGLGDPAYDFAGLLSGYGENLVQRCAISYPEIDSFLPRIRFYRGTFALLEALFGVENGDDAAFQAGIEQYL
jgi:aminoglycoside 2''-phosphotransferase